LLFWLIGNDKLVVRWSFIFFRRIAIPVAGICSREVQTGLFIPWASPPPFFLMLEKQRREKQVENAVTDAV
jgi:hypothetical protein